jgi:hypothetical protein
MKTKSMKKPAKSRPAKELTDELLESGADLSAFMQKPRVVPAMFDALKVNVDFPAWVVQALDCEANRVGVPRQSLIKLWIVERLESSRRAAPATSS